MSDRDTMTSSKNPAYAIGWQQVEMHFKQNTHALKKQYG